MGKKERMFLKKGRRILFLVKRGERRNSIMFFAESR